MAYKAREVIVVGELLMSAKEHARAGLLDITGTKMYLCLQNSKRKIVCNLLFVRIFHSDCKNTARTLGQGNLNLLKIFLFLLMAFELCFI